MTTAPDDLEARYDQFFVLLARNGIVSRSAKHASISKRQAYERRHTDREFAERWAEALEEFADNVENAARARAVKGVEEPVIYQGQPTYLYRLDENGRPVLGEDGKPLYEMDATGRPKVLTVRRYSDSLLALMLKAKRKREYGDSSKLELTGADGGPVQIEDSPIVSARKIAFAMALGLRAAEQQASEPALTDGSDLA